MPAARNTTAFAQIVHRTHLTPPCICTTGLVFLDYLNGLCDESLGGSEVDQAQYVLQYMIRYNHITCS
jgi:hypothetical protein